MPGAFLLEHQLGNWSIQTSIRNLALTQLGFPLRETEAQVQTGVEHVAGKSRGGYCLTQGWVRWVNGVISSFLVFLCNGLILTPFIFCLSVSSLQVVRRRWSGYRELLAPPSQGTTLRQRKFLFSNPSIKSLGRNLVNCALVTCSPVGLITTVRAAGYSDLRPHQNHGV